MNPIVFYERRLEGFIRSRFVVKGMSYERVREILGGGDGCVGGLGGFTHFYFDYGVTLHFPLALGKEQCEGVSTVAWRFQRYPGGGTAFGTK